MPHHLPTTPAPSQSATHFWNRKQGSQLFEWNHAASVKSKQLNLLFQSFYAFGRRISVLLTKMKFQLYGGVDYVTFWISFNLALFFTVVISWFYFITFWDLALEHLEIYLFRERNKQQQNCWNSGRHCSSSGTAQSICFVLQRTSRTALQESCSG